MILREKSHHVRNDQFEYLLTVMTNLSFWGIPAIR